MSSSKASRNARSIQQVKKDHELDLLNIDGVTGVGIGERDDKTKVIKVYVVKKTPDINKKIPADLEGHPVQIETTGEFHAF